MNPDTGVFIFVMWVCIFGVIVYRKTSSNTVFLACGCIITVFLLTRVQIGQNFNSGLMDLDGNMIEWLDCLVRAKDDDERDRCYNEISNMLHSKALSNDLSSKGMSKGHQTVLRLLQKYKPKYPIPQAVLSEPQYDISVGYCASSDDF